MSRGFFDGWTSEQIVQHGQSLLRETVIPPDAIDIELLNWLRQPTTYQRRHDRRDALDRMIYHAERGMRHKFEGDEMFAKHHLVLAERYKAKYEFTQEEINARIEETGRYAQGVAE